MNIHTIDFKDTEADLTTLGKVCQELEDKGLPPNEAAAHVLASMANQAIANGMDPKEAIDALHQVITAKGEKPRHQEIRFGKKPLTPEQLAELECNLRFLQNFLLYYDMILCSEIQRYAYVAMDKLREKGLYRHELKKYANVLTDEARRLQMRVKDNDRAKVFKWISRMDEKGVFGKDYHADGGSVVSRLVLSFQKEFASLWAVVELDCRTIAKHSPSHVEDIVTVLFKIEALTNTGIELFDTCVKKMKSLVAGHGTSSISKSTHHESMRHACWNLLGKLGADLGESAPAERARARQHLADMQRKMVQLGMDDFFQKEFDQMGEEFVDYMIARMRMGIHESRMPTGAIRMVYERLGTKHRVKKFFLQLAAVHYPDGADVDVFDVADAIADYTGNRSELDRFRRFCIEGTRFKLPESEDKQEARMLRVLARRHSYMLPDDILRAMFMKQNTKKTLMEKLHYAGFELKPTLRRVQKMKVAELKQL